MLSLRVIVALSALCFVPAIALGVVAARADGHSVSSGKHSLPRVVAPPNVSSFAPEGSEDGPVIELPEMVIVEKKPTKF